MEHGPQDEPLVDHATALESDGRGSRAAGHRRGGDGLLLAELACVDELLRDGAAAWKELVRRLDGLRREIAVASTQVRRSRSLAARKASRDGGADQETRPPGPDRDEARATWLTQEFEAALRETEKRRVALHAEMEDLPRRREALLRRLPAALSRAYQSLADAGRVPAIVAVADGVCGGCKSPLAESVIEASSHGAVAVCARCDRLLCPCRGGE